MNERKARREMNKWNKLILSVAIDFVGMSSYIVPGAGNISDIGWAPVQAFIVHHLYNNRLLTTLSFIEEVLPFTDIVPSATIGWLMEYTRGGKKAQGEAEQMRK
ncbi:hypothetical protein WJX75_008562 [Coccomyxa subellipsoidea]|uniref:Uncharacterized protein n=1 Tax=Coccomyxa subellipsoidea TaxID=248742 RepID=A0ABR2YZ28_9CHLO